MGYQRQHLINKEHEAGKKLAGMANEKQVLTHKWQSLGLGDAPFKMVGLYTLPSTDLAEKNPSAYNAQLNAMPRGYGIGSCGVCGMGLTNNYLINSADGKKFAVGCDCVGKTNDSKLISETHAKKLKVAREKAQIARDAKNEARRVAREAELQAQRDRNDGLTDYEWNQKTAQDEAQARREANRSKVAYFLDHLSTDGFAGDLRSSIENGVLPRGRGLTIMLSIIAKTAGRTNSKAYNAKYDEAEAELLKLEKVL